jgi:hypothetical protein
MSGSGAALVMAVTPGRSGSVFLADVLRRSFGRRATITHERLGPGQTLPRVFFHAYEGARFDELAAFPPVAEFLDALERDLEKGPVIEVGMFSSHLIPLMAARFPDRLRVIGLFRHPLITAASHSVRGMYHGWPHWSYFHLANLTPFDPGATAIAFRQRWEAMTPVEKNMYCWLEYAQLWAEVRRRFHQIPSVEIRSESLFAKPAEWCSRVAAMAELDGPVIVEGVRKNELESKGILRFGVDGWRSYRSHPEVLEAAARMGYGFDDADLANAMRKYEAPGTRSYRSLRALRWFHVKGYLGRLLRPRFWHQYRRFRRLRRQYPEYFRLMYGRG